MDARTLAVILNGEVVGPDRVLAPGPGHSARDRSMSVVVDPTAPDGFLVHSFAGDDWRMCRDHIRNAAGLDSLRLTSRRSVTPSRTRVRGVTASTTTAHALAVWNRASDPHGTTLTQKYLAGRKLTLPPGDTVIRQVVEIEKPGAIMVALMRDVLTDEAVAVHRTYISEAGHKTHRKFVGPSRGAAIKLVPASDTLTVAEGLETALAAFAAGMRSVWALGSSGAIGALSILASVTTLVILAENDSGASRRAVSACSQTWWASGRRVFVITPTKSKDFADVWACAGAGWRDHVNIERVRQ